MERRTTSIYHCNFFSSPFLLLQRVYTPHLDLFRWKLFNPEAVQQGMINTCHARRRIVEEIFPTEGIYLFISISITLNLLIFDTKNEWKLKSPSSIFLNGKFQSAKIFKTKYLKSEIIFISIPATIFGKNLDKYPHTEISGDILCNKTIALALTINFSTTKLKSIDLISKYWKKREGKLTKKISNRRNRFCSTPFFFLSFFSNRERKVSP